MTDLPELLRSGCVSYSNALVKWPHRLLHEAADEIERLRAAMQDAHDHLMNLQPHIQMLHKNSQPFIDSHVDCAMAALAKPPDDGSTGGMK